MKNGEGVEVFAVGEFATGIYLKSLAHFRNIEHSNPAGFVGNLLEVEAKTGLPRVGGAAGLLDGRPLANVVESDTFGSRHGVALPLNLKQ